jgi:glucose-1-phosphate thymidylyltransferase
MKAIILAGGFAKRLQPLTKETPKPLLPILGKPIIQHLLEKVQAVPNIDKIFVSTNKKFERHFTNWMSYIKNSKNVELVIENHSSDDKKLGAIGSLKHLIDKYNIDDDVMILAGDNLFEFQLADFVNYYNEKKTPVVAFFDMVNIKKVRGRYGVVILDENKKVKEFQEKPEQPNSTLVSTGCYIFSKEVLGMIDEYLWNKNNPDAPGFFLEWLSKKVDVHGFVFKERWFDIGHIDCYNEANVIYCQ